MGRGFRSERKLFSRMFLHCQDTPILAVCSTFRHQNAHIQVVCPAFRHQDVCPGGLVRINCDQRGLGLLVLEPLSYFLAYS